MKSLEDVWDMSYRKMLLYCATIPRYESKKNKNNKEENVYATDIAAADKQLGIKR